MSDTVITRKIEIDMGHRVPDHKSKCSSIHGHRYVIEAECTGPVLLEGSQKGMVVDFGFLKSAMMAAIDHQFDHALCMYHQDPLLNDIIDTLAKHKQKIVPMLEVPTAENLARLWYEFLFDELAYDDEVPEGVKLLAVRVWETPNCVAEYRPIPH